MFCQRQTWCGPYAIREDQAVRKPQNVPTAVIDVKPGEDPSKNFNVGKGQSTMSKNAQHVFDRRELLAASVVALGGALMATEPIEAYPKNVNTNSRPSPR